MNGIIEAAIHHSRTVVSLLILILIAGIYSYATIPKEADPDVNIPLIYISLSLEGVSPDDAVSLLIKPIEQEVSSIEGVKEVRSIGFDGGANVTLEFEAGFDADQALLDTREKVDLAKPELPADAEEPSIHEVNFSLFPVIVITLSGDVPERTLLSISNDLQDAIEKIPSVLEANIKGDREEEIQLIVDPLAIESYGLDARQLLQSVDLNNRVVTAGDIDTGTGRFAVRVPGLYETPADILNTPVKQEGDAVVRFSDIGRLYSTFTDPSGFVSINGKPGLSIEVSKRTGENLIETIEYVKAIVEAGRPNWPEEISVNFSQDKSTNIKNMLTDLQNNVISAILLVMIVIVAALGTRSAALVGIAIPGSFLAAIMVLSTIGLTINIVVLFSLILAVGMLVDGAVIITEYADRKMIEGYHRREAYGLAAKRMAWPVIASTSTTLAAFLPLMFWPGVVGEFMKFLPLTLIATLIASLAMALIFIPTLGSLFGKTSGTVDPDKAKALAAGEGDVEHLGGFTGFYVRILRTALRYPTTVVASGIALLVIVQIAYANLGKGVEFFPDVEPETIQVWIHGRGNMSIHEKDVLVKEVESLVLELQREKGEFHSIYAVTQHNPERGGARDEPEDLIGTIQLEFTDWWSRRPAEEIMTDLRERTRDVAGINVEIHKENAGPAAGKPIQIQLVSEDHSKLTMASGQITEAMEDLGGYINIEDGLPVPGIEIELSLDRAQAAKFDADVSLIGSYVQLITRGLKIASYRPERSDEEIDITVRVPETYRTLTQLRNIRVQTNAGMVPISNFISWKAKPSVGLIHRVDGERVINIKSDVGINPQTDQPYLVDSKVQEIKQWIADAELPPGVGVRFKGEDEEQQKAMAFLSKAFLVALFLIAIILVTQFNSFYSAFLILTAVIMSTIGVFLGLLITQQPFGIVMGGIGVIALAGIVVNNNIVLIDTYDRLKKESHDHFDAILRTGAQRLRPVLLTSITTVLGLMPMVLRLNVDFVNRVVQFGAPSTQWWQQLATAVSFGLTFATVLTLVFTPCALMMKANFENWWKQRRLHKRKQRENHHHQTGEPSQSGRKSPLQEAAE